MGTSYLYILVFLVSSSRAGPVKSNSVRLRRDGDSVNANATGELNGCLLDNVEYSRGDEVPSLGPCERCVCEAPDVVCSMIKCQQNSGCRIIQQSGQCCPEYKCDCEYNGRIYNNGERLDKPEDPCQVCYCKGGEIMCTSITCYERDDCKPHFSPGQCCPRYDHCPVETGRVSLNSVRSVNASLYSPKREMQPWPLTKPSNVPSSVNYDESNGAHNNVYPQTIKIVEILPTTPGYDNKPSEVSVIPRLKTNDQGEAKDQEVKTIEEDIQSPSSTTETSDSLTTLGSSTSEIEHLLDTTPETDGKNSEQKIEATPERTVSTLNPLSENIYQTNGPDPQPDSEKFATVFPNYYYTEGELNNVEEATTAEGVTELEGSGYELLTGGLYEDNSSESSVGEEIQMTTIKSDISTDSITKLPEDVSSKTEHPPRFEAFTATESYSGEGNFTSKTDDFEKIAANDTSSEESDSSNESSELKSELSSALVNNSAVSSSNESDSEENISETTQNENTTSGSGSTDSLYSVSPDNSQYSDLNLSTYNYEVGIESSSEAFNDKSTISTESSTESTSESLISDTTIDSNENDELSYNDTTSSSMHSLNDGTETSTQLQKAFEMNESTTEFDVAATNDNPSLLVPQGRMKSSRLTNRNFNSENISTLTFPSVLNVHTLGYNQTNLQKESLQNENVTSMAKVGIYHPAKANELAGYLTVVDDKTKLTTADDKVISSHILLTPNDLKKLAEILIHEKIKPADLDDIKSRNSNSDISYDDFETTTNTQRPGSEKLWGSVDSGNMEEKPESPRSKQQDSQSSKINSMNEESQGASVTTHGNINGDGNNNESGATISRDELIRNLVSSTLPSNVVINESNIEDPNTSRQIRTPENTSHQYSALLDDRDLLILENFFRRNMGLQ